MRCGQVHGDEHTLRALAERFERATPFELAFAVRTRSAAAPHIESGCVDLVLVDLALPDQDIYEITRRAAAQQRAVCVLVGSKSDLARLSL
ncbi:MAG: hypothetical protein ABI895_03880 [Deltaproteobacteria bacterium]